MSRTLLCGAAMLDITPPLGLAMAGFGARAKPADAVHDRLTVRALVVEDTAILVADVIGIDGEMSARIRSEAPLQDDRIIVAALHNHGGPVSMAGRLGTANSEYLLRLETACIAAIGQAAARRRPCTLALGSGPDPGVGKNRRHKNGPVDRHLPTLFIRDEDGRPVALLVAYACHPVVLAANNTAWTADYPHFVRRALEAAYPEAMAIFLTAACGDVNTGHSAYDSMRLAPTVARTFAEAERIGRLIAECALSAKLTSVNGDGIGVARREVVLHFLDRDASPPNILATRWRDEATNSDEARRSVLAGMINWAERARSLPTHPWRGHVTAFDWLGMKLIGLPGEPFVETATNIRNALSAHGADPSRVFVLGYCNDNPGYFPPKREYVFGGYEVEEAHRLYGMRSPFAPGSAELLEAAALEAADSAKLQVD